MKYQIKDTLLGNLLQRALFQQKTKQLDFGRNYPIKTQSGENPLVTMFRAPNQKIEFVVGKFGEIGRGYGIYRENRPTITAYQPTTESSDAEFRLSAVHPTNSSDEVHGDFFISLENPDFEAWDIHAIPLRSQGGISLGIIQHDGFIEFPDPVSATEFLIPSAEIQVRISKARTIQSAGNRTTPGAIPRRTGLASDGKEGPPGITGVISPWRSTNDSNSNATCLSAQDSFRHHDQSRDHLCDKPHQQDTWDDDPETNILRYDNYLNILATKYSSIWNYPNKSWDKDDLLNECRMHIWKGKCSGWIGVSSLSICRRIVKEVAIELRRYDLTMKQLGHLTKTSLTNERNPFKTDIALSDLLSDLSISFQSSSCKDLQEVIERIQNAISTLTEQDRQLIHLKYWQNQSNKEICQITGISLAAVKSRWQRIKKKLKPLLPVPTRKR